MTEIHEYGMTPPPEDDVQTATDVLRCPVCELLLKDPVTLSCGNTLCRACLPAFDLATAWRFICPVSTCTRTSHLFGDIKVDVTLHKLIDIVQKEIERREASSQARSALVRRENENEEAKDDENSWPAGSSTSSTSAENTIFKNMLVGELECQVCYLVYYDPVTTPCGHTFCKSCILRSIDHSLLCPLCRHKLPGYPFFLNHVTNNTVQTFTTTLFPLLWEERRIAISSELYHDSNDVPIFVCSLVFPKNPCFLHIFEPRYRLMIRRCLESRRRRFGMCLPGRGNQPYHEYGTMLEIRSVEVLPDGRSLVETIGTHRFRVIERGHRDGYFTAKIERVEDLDPAEEAELERLTMEANEQALKNERQLSTQEMISKAREFINTLRNAATPWLLNRLASTFGEMPNDPSDFVWWCAAVMPVEEFDKYKILKYTTVRERMLVINGWIDMLKEQWWYSRGGCVIV